MAADRETWNRRVTDFEVAMGAADFHDPAVRQSIADTVVALRDSLLVLNDPHPGESRADYERRIESVFFRHDPTSAGNVGFDVPFAELLEHGDPRELMTAAWNAAYINAKPVYEGNRTEASSLYDPSYLNSPRTEVLSESLIRAAESQQTDRLRLAGIDAEKVAARLKWQDAYARDLARRAELSGPIKRFSGANDERIFARDFFSTSAVVMEAADRMRTGISILLSKVGMTPREGDAQLPFVHTAQEYADMNAPVGELSKRYLQQYMDGPIDDPTVKLPWREGLALHDKNNSWTKMVEDRGMTKVDGVSPTTSKMLLLGDFLGFDDIHQEQFLKGLMAWMLPSRDHSLPEIAAGAQMLDLGPLRGHPVKMDSDPVTFYQRALDWHSQTGPALDMTVPHREHYVDLINRGELTELTQNTDLRGEVPDLVRSVREQLTSGVVTDIHPGEGESAKTTLHSWLERHGVDPRDRAAVQELAAKIPEADLYAIGAYTLHMHPYMTAAVTVHGMADAVTRGHTEGVSRHLFDKGVNSYIDHYLEGLAEGKVPARLPMALRHVFHEGDRLTAASPKSGHTQRWLDAHRRLQAALADPGTPRSVTKVLNQELEQARTVIGDLVAPHLPKLFDEVLTHSDMLQGALTNLPTIGTPDQPVWTFRGDGMDAMARLRYGVTARSTATARQFISTSLEHETALLFVKDSHPIYVAYRLTGQYARDISAFTVYKDTPEVLLPLGAVTRRVTDPALIEEARRQIPWDRLPPGTKLIVMEEVPHA